MVDLPKIVAANVKSGRVRAGLTQVRLGEIAGYSEEWIRRIERGDGSASLEAIGAISKALEIEPFTLLLEGGRVSASALSAEIDRLGADERAWIADLVSLMQRRPSKGDTR